MKHTSANLLPLVPAAVYCICGRLDYDFLLGLPPANHTCAVNRCAPDTPSCNGRLCLILSQRYNVNIQISVPAHFLPRNRQTGQGQARPCPAVPTTRYGPFSVVPIINHSRLGRVVATLNKAFQVAQIGVCLARSRVQPRPIGRPPLFAGDRTGGSEPVGSQPAHLSVTCREPERCGHRRSVGTPVTVFKMMGNKRSPAHIDWQEDLTNTIHPCKLRAGTAWVPVLRPPSPEGLDRELLQGVPDFGRFEGPWTCTSSPTRGPVEPPLPRLVIASYCWE